MSLLNVLNTFGEYLAHSTDEGIGFQKNSLCCVIWYTVNIVFLTELFLKAWCFIYDCVLVYRHDFSGLSNIEE
jgi:hypothetical protein